MLKTEGLVKKLICIYETYKNTVITYWRHIYSKVTYTAKAKMCKYPQSDHALTNWKCVLQCFAKCICANLPDQATDYQYSDTSTSIKFYIYHLILHCRTHGRIPLNDNKSCRICKHYSVS